MPSTDPTRNSQRPSEFRHAVTKLVTKLATVSLDELAIETVASTESAEQFRAALAEKNPALAELLTVRSALDVAAVPSGPTLPPAEGRGSELGESSEASPDQYPEHVRAMAEELDSEARTRGLLAVRLSLTLPSPALDRTRAALCELCARVSELGPGRGLLAAVDRRKRRRDGHGPHGYALGLFASKAEAVAVRDAWLVEHGADRASNVVKALGEDDERFRVARFRRLHFVRSTAYLAKPWPRECGEERDAMLDVVASGPLAPVLDRHRAAVFGVAGGRRCKRCGTPLPPAKRVGRPRETCSGKCRTASSAARRGVTESPSTVSLQASEPDTKPPSLVSSQAGTDTESPSAVSLHAPRAATSEELDQALVEALDFEGDDAPWSAVRETALRELASRGLQEPAGGALLMALPKARRERAGAQP